MDLSLQSNESHHDIEQFNHSMIHQQNYSTPVFNVHTKIRKKHHDTNEIANKQDINLLQQPSTLPTTFELKHAAEKKFRHRYLKLQNAYEKRLQSLSNQVVQAVQTLQNDPSIQYLHENPLLSEFAAIRIGEIIQENFFGEREQCMKSMNDQLAWQASDISEAHQVIHTLQKREKVLQNQYKSIEIENKTLKGQLNEYLNEIQTWKQQTTERNSIVRMEVQEKEELQQEMNRLVIENHKIPKLKEKMEKLQYALTKTATKAKEKQEELVECKMTLEKEKLQIVHENQQLRQEITHLKDKIAFNESSNAKFVTTVEQLQHERKYSELLSQIKDLETQLQGEKQAHHQLREDNIVLKQKYDDFTVQVTQYMDEQSIETTQSRNEAQEQERKLLDELTTTSTKYQEELRKKQQEITQISDQLKSKQEAFQNLERAHSSLQLKFDSMELSLANDTKKNAAIINGLETNLSEWKHLFEMENSKRTDIENLLQSQKEIYEQQIVTLRKDIKAQSDSQVQQIEKDSRIQWQSDYISQHEAKVDALKEKYDRIIEKKQHELLAAQLSANDDAKDNALKLQSLQKTIHELEQKLALCHEREQERNEEDYAKKLRQAATIAAQEAKEKIDAAEKQSHSLLLDMEREKRKQIEENMGQQIKQLEKDHKSRESQLAEALEQQRKAIKVVKQQLEKSERELASEKARYANKFQSEVLEKEREKIREETRREEQKKFEIEKKQLQKSKKTHGFVPNVVVVNMTPTEERKPETPKGNVLTHNINTPDQSEKQHTNEINSIPLLQHELLMETKEMQLKKAHEENLKLALEKFAVEKEKELSLNQVNMRVEINHIQIALEKAENDKNHVEKVLQQERKELVTLRADNLEWKEERQSIMHRLEQANENIGKLRHIIKKFTEDRKEMEKRLESAKHAILTKENDLSEAIDSASKLENECQNLHKQNNLLLQDIQVLKRDAETNTKDINDAIKHMQNKADKLESINHRLSEEEAQTIRKHEIEMKELKGVMTKQILDLEESLRSAELTTIKLESKIDSLDNEKQKHLVQLQLQEAEMKKQKKEYADLSRMYRNLNGAVKQSSESEHSALQLVESIRMERSNDRQHFRSLLSSMHKSLRKDLHSIQSQWKDGKCSIQIELEGMWHFFQREMVRMSLEMRKRAEVLTRHEREFWEQKIEKDIALWEDKRAQEVHEVEVLRQNERDNNNEALKRLQQELSTATLQCKEEKNRSKYSIQQLQELELKQKQANDKIQEVQDSLQKTTTLLEQSGIEQRHLNDKLSQLSSICQLLQKFIIDIMKKHDVEGVDLFEKIVESIKDDKGDSKLAFMLEKLGKEFHKRIKSVIHEAKSSQSTPIQNQLTDIKNCFASLHWEDIGSHQTAIHTQLPWYIACVNAVQLQKERLLAKITQLERELKLCNDELQNARHVDNHSNEKINMIVLEKDTLIRELRLEMKNLNVKFDRERRDWRQETDAKVDKVKHFYTKEKIKIENERQTAMANQADLLDRERQTMRKLKDEYSNYRANAEKIQEEMKDKVERLEKELVDLQEMSQKWKSKVKQHAIKSPRTPRTPSKPPLGLTSSIRSVSNSPFRFQNGGAYITSIHRRPLSPMADLTTLMEQSLGTMQKDPVGASHESTSPIFRVLTSPGGRRRKSDLQGVPPTPYRSRNGRTISLNELL